MCAADFPIEEKKFGLLLLPEVHRRPGEGDLGKEKKSTVWMKTLGRRRKVMFGWKSGRCDSPVG